MQKKYLHRYRLVSDELWKQKRVVLVKALDNTSKDEPEVLELEKRAQENEEAVQEQLGKTSEQASEQLKADGSFRSNQIQGIIEDWSYRATERIYRFFGGNLLGVSNKADLDNAVTVAAKAKVDAMAAELGMQGDLIVKHGNNSLSILKEKRELLSNLKSDVQKSLSNDKNELKELNDLRKKMGFWKRSNSIIGWSEIRDLNARVAQLTKVGETVDLLQTETRDKEKKKGGVEKEMQNFDQRMREVVLRKNPELAGPLDQIIRETILNTRDLGAFEEFLRNPELKLSERAIVTANDLMNLMLKGRNILPDGIARWRGQMTGADVQDYFIKKQLDRGVLNRDNDSTAERMKRLTSFPLGQEVKFGQAVYHVTRKAGSRIHIRNGIGMKGVIDISKADLPVLTISDQKGVLNSWTLKSDKNKKPSLIAIEFTKATKIERRRKQKEAT